MENLKKTTANFVPALSVQPYERYLPSAFDESLSILQKINKVIHQLNLLGQITNSVVQQWNELMDWITGNGLNEIVNNIITDRIEDGTFDALFEKIIGNLDDLQTAEKENIVTAINELGGVINFHHDNIGNIDDLYDFGNLVDAINELHKQVVVIGQDTISIGESTGYGIISGLKVTQQPVLSMAVDVGDKITPNIVHLKNGVRYELTSQSIPINDAHPTLSRIDAIYINPDGIISYISGDVSVNPIPPTIPNLSVLLAHVNVVANDTSINNVDILDKRQMKTLNSLLTTNKSNLVEAINEVITSLNDVINMAIGDVANLPTDDKSSIVNAIIELFNEKAEKTDVDTLIGDVIDLIGELTQQTSNDNEALNNTINDILQTIGVKEELTTNDKENLVVAINELVVSLQENTQNTTSEIERLENNLKDGFEQIENDLTTKVNKNSLVINVKDHGLKGDNLTDDTQALKVLLTKTQLGDVLYFPKGIYLLTEQIVLPKGIELLGVGSELAPQYDQDHWVIEEHGSVIAIKYGQNEIANDKAAFLVNSFNTIRGINFWYPMQSGSNPNPLKYPPTLGMISSDPTEANGRVNQINIKDCLFVNSYTCISFTSPHELVTIENVKFAAWFKGIIMENSYDVDRLINIHSNPNICYRGEWAGNNIFSYHVANDQTRGFVIGKNDHLYIDKCFIYGFNTALEFNKVTDGFINGCFVNESGFEGCAKCVVLAGDYRRISFNQCMFGTHPLFMGAEPTFLAQRPSMGMRNELRLIDCHTFLSNGRALQFNNQYDVSIVNSHFYGTLSKQKQYVTDAIRIMNSKKVDIHGCTIELDRSFNNSNFYQIENSRMISIVDTDFTGYTGNELDSSSVILNSEHVRVIRPRYSDTTNPNTYQNETNVDVVIDDLIRY